MNCIFICTSLEVSFRVIRDQLVYNQDFMIFFRHMLSRFLFFGGRIYVITLDITIPIYFRVGF